VGLDVGELKCNAIFFDILLEKVYSYLALLWDDTIKTPHAA
jgi:hypothetical protein